MIGMLLLEVIDFKKYHIGKTRKDGLPSVEHTGSKPCTGFRQV